MSDQLHAPKQIAIAVHPDMPEALTESKLIADFLSGQGIKILEGSLEDRTLRRRLTSGGFELLLVVGGDGTMLRAGHLCGPLGIPILGINLGRFGFLMEVRRDQWREMLPLLLEGKYWLEKRMMLRAEHWRLGKMLAAWDVLNEAFIGRGEIVRPVHLITNVDDSFLTTYVADGVIVATATGSTAYALAAGGPILPPQLRNLLIVPVAPHLSVDRAVVLAEGASVAITVHTTHQAALSVDGNPPLAMTDGDCVRVSAAEHTVDFVRFQDRGYFYRNLTSHMNQNPASGNSR